MQFDNSRILSLIEKGLNEAIATAANKAKNHYNKMLSQRESNYYDRTGDIERALNNPSYIKILGNSTVQVSIYNKDYIKAKNSIKDNFFNHHQSFSGVSSVENVVIYQDEGYTINKGTSYSKKVPGMNFSSVAFDNQKWDDYLANKAIEEIIDELYYEIDKIAKGGGA